MKKLPQLDGENVSKNITFESCEVQISLDQSEQSGKVKSSRIKLDHHPLTDLIEIRKANEEEYIENKLKLQIIDWKYTELF